MADSGILGVLVRKGVQVRILPTAQMNRRQNIDSILYDEESAGTYPDLSDCWNDTSFDEREDRLDAVFKALEGRDCAGFFTGFEIVPLTQKTSMFIGSFLKAKQITVTDLSYLDRDKVYVVTAMGEHRFNHGIMVEVTELPCLEKIGWYYLDNFINV